jgi:hypothetical protein
MLVEKINVEDYRRLHKNGNRICFDFFPAKCPGYFHIRLLDGDNYQEPEHTSYIVIEYFDDAEPDYYKFHVKAAFDLLAMHSRLVNFPHHNKDAEEQTFIQKYYDYIEGEEII